MNRQQLTVRAFGDTTVHLDEKLPAHLVHKVNVVQNKYSGQVPQRVSSQLRNDL